MNLVRFAPVFAFTTLAVALTAGPAVAEGPADAPSSAAAPAPDVPAALPAASDTKAPVVAPGLGGSAPVVAPAPLAADEEVSASTRPSSPTAGDATVIAGRDADGIVVDRPAPASRGMHKVAFGVRAGQSRFGLSAQGLADKGMPVDNWSDRALLVAPTFCVGGDGYFIKLEAPIMKTSTASAYGFGIYPLNFGYLFERAGLFPYGSAGVAASVLTLPGQGASGAFAVARLAAGLKARVASGFAVSAEVGYSPFAAAALVDKQKTHDLVQSAIDGGNIDPPAGMRPARGGIGRELDFVVGLEWM